MATRATNITQRFITNAIPISVQNESGVFPRRKNASGDGFFKSAIPIAMKTDTFEEYSTDE